MLLQKHNTTQCNQISSLHNAYSQPSLCVAKKCGRTATYRRSPERKKSSIFLTINPYLGSILTYQFQHILAIFRCSFDVQSYTYLHTYKASFPLYVDGSDGIYRAPFNSPAMPHKSFFILHYGLASFKEIYKFCQYRKNGMWLDWKHKISHRATYRASHVEHGSQTSQSQLKAMLERI